MDISVIIPAYNCAKLIKEAVDSIFKSQLSAAEIIIINDGSSDDTGTVAKELSKKYSTVRVIDQNNTGVSAARNRGILEASGEYLMFMDADDALEPGSLADADRILGESRPDMLLFGLSFDYYHRSRCYRSEKLVYPKSGLMSRTEWGAELTGLYRANMLSPVWNKLIRRELVIDHAISFHEEMIEMEDYLFSVACLARCERIFVLDRLVYRYRQAENERGTYNRLWRIKSLSDYVRPFYDAAQLFGSEAPEIVRIADQIYSVLFCEQIRFASVRQIRLAAEDMLSGCRRHVIERLNPRLYQDLKNKKYLYVWVKRTVSRIRHRAAVYLKYRRSLKNKG